MAGVCVEKCAEEVVCEDLEDDEGDTNEDLVAKEGAEVEEMHLLVAQFQTEVYQSRRTLVEREDAVIVALEGRVVEEVECVKVKSGSRQVPLQSIG